MRECVRACVCGGGYSFFYVVIVSDCLVGVGVLCLLFAVPWVCSVAFRGGSRISGKEVHMNNGVRNRFADFISFFLKYPMKIK